ncbi:MAG TPA: undecaprenyl-diphosphate phosphatase [Alphaproteobacteria bacterium]|jgi:undecaprenyl-diphosphatase|nr:undecaprenyl-diphosphate phosphatase [Alphaproteobacteria bacterium]
MTLLHIVVLAAVQGVTEFLPVSSSGHLILIPALTGWPDQTLIADTAVHVGTLAAVLVYFRREVGQVLLGMVRLLQRRPDAGSRLFGLLVAATVPVVVAGAVLEYANLDGSLRSAEVVAWMTLVFGVVLYLADRMYLTVRRIEQMKLGAAVLIGVAQILALVPGTSRSGITMTAARMLGFERRDAARFSMLLSIPAILAAGVLEGWELARTDDAQLTLDALFAAVLSFGFALIAISALMAWLQRATFTPFAVYRVVLGAGLLVWIYGGGF